MKNEGRKYKVLGSVARNFAHSFTSLMNYRDDDYVIGHLLSAARNSGEEKLEINILTGLSTPEALKTPPVKNAIESYIADFPRLVASHGASINLLSAAVMTIEFDLSVANKKYGSVFESPYVCRVILEDDREKQWKAELSGWWYPESEPIKAHKKAWWQFWKV